MVDALRVLVHHESPTNSKSLMDVLADYLALRFQRVGVQAQVLDNPYGGNHVRVDCCPEGVDENAKPGLIICHFDTVWPEGTLETMPFYTQDDCAYGPGTYDMKASIVMVEFALRAMRDLEQFPTRPLVLLLNSDEETGSPTSRDLIEKQAAESEYVFVMEPSLIQGGVKTSRKGVGYFEMVAQGLSAHAGVEPEKGRSAIVEIAHQIQTLHALNDYEVGTTVNIGVVDGGTRSNVVPERAHLIIDTRAWTQEEADRVTHAILTLQSQTEGVQVRTWGGFNRPPMPRSPHVLRLYEKVAAVAADLEMELPEYGVGGGSDANLTAAIGIPTLDGLGPVGAGAHAAYEHIRLDTWAQRTTLLTSCLLRL